ncbi:hypothetical protein F4780DRAFT_778561 [Xylariomycetidae sp. FL0641]|nr:hypothetical protein F4780DRAFT_778561 [Xylariomycetidae sp. FL0641]
MCITTHYRSLSCGHHWLAIRTPCWPGCGFSVCPTFVDGRARDPADECAVTTICPACMTNYHGTSTTSVSTCYGGYGYGGYDRNRVRMIVNIRDRCRWGVGPSKGDPGVECAVM